MLAQVGRRTRSALGRIAVEESACGHGRKRHRGPVRRVRKPLYSLILPSPHAMLCSVPLCLPRAAAPGSGRLALWRKANPGKRDGSGTAKRIRSAGRAPGLCSDGHAEQLMRERGGSGSTALCPARRSGRFPPTIASSRTTNAGQSGCAASTSSAQQAAGFCEAHCPKAAQPFLYLLPRELTGSRPDSTDRRGA